MDKDDMPCVVIIENGVETQKQSLTFEEFKKCFRQFFKDEYLRAGIDNDLDCTEGY